VAVPDSTVNYSRLTAADPSRDYTIGIFDTGASALVTGFAAATDAGLYSLGLVTDNEIRLTGVTGWVDANISYPLGVFIDGLNAIDPNGRLTDVSGMMGETNVAIVVGQDNGPGIPDLPTAIGTPLSVYYTAAFYNDQPVIRMHKNKIYRAPKIDLYTQTDGSIPSYPNTMPLELRPLGGVSVQYTPNLQDMMEILDTILGGGEVNFDEPGNPSIIIGNLSQSIFFVHSVDLQDNGNSATDKDRFMYDTGAQVTVIGSRIGARLGLNRASREFVVEIEGVDGTSIDADGFYVDALNIPALGQWLKFTDVPVILLDVFSAEGGTVDGIIGMNLFTKLNFVLHGGGLFLQDDPKVEFEFVDSLPLLGDVAPDGGNGVVDIADLRVFIEAWLGTLDPQSANWNPDCDIAPKYTPDGVVNLLDLVLFAQEWQSGTE